MARPRKPTNDYMFDQFADLPVEDQAACLEIMRQIHRLAVRESKQGPYEPKPEVSNGE